VNLLELVSDAARPDVCVPAWALGCFRRRSISFFDGFTDATTQVLWLQSWGLTFDLRLAAERPRCPGFAALAEASPDDAVALAEAEGGIARTSAELVAAGTHQARFSWDDWDGVQPYAKWPEPGTCRRVGDCLIEFAPSGAYVEDWRYQAAGTGPLIGLRLLEERDRDSGALLHRGGGLLICGRHAGFVRGRARPLPEGSRAADMVRAAPRDPDLLEMVFGCEASYGCATGTGAYVVAASTLPWREGEPLLSLDGFVRAGAGTLLQHARERDRNLERRFRVDTLAEQFPELPATAVTAEGAAWLAAERATLQR
jgi:hypothetical protein